MNWLGLGVAAGSCASSRRASAVGVSAGLRPPGGLRLRGGEVGLHDGPSVLGR